MRIPGIIVAGDQRSWIDYPFSDRDGNSYSSSSHNLSYEIRGPIAAAKLTLAAVAQGTGWQTTITAAQSQPLNPAPSAVDNTWFWQAFATAIVGGARALAGEGVMLVRPNLAVIDNATTYDGRTQDEKDLAALDAAISARLNGGEVEEYSIAGRSLRKTPMKDLVALRTRLVIRVRRARAAQSVANGLGNPSRTGVRFR